jgi:hypothetical protein
MASESVSISKPWYRLALMGTEDFLMKKKERKNPWMTPIIIKTDMKSRWVSVFITQM